MDESRMTNPECASSLGAYGGLYRDSPRVAVQKDTLPPDISGSLPELFAARHTTIAKYRIGVEHFAVCSCGHVEEIFTDT